MNVFIFLLLLKLAFIKLIFAVNTTEVISKSDSSSTFKEPLDFHCVVGDKKLVIIGKSIRFQSILDVNGKLNYTCRLIEKIEKVLIFAWDTVIIDNDFNAVGEEILLGVVTPAWEIVGIRTINLNGLKGNDIPRPADTGKKGAPGNPGGNAGRFFGVGGQFTNDDRLKIYANGGNGGSGQRGSDGSDGKDAIFPYLNNLEDTILRRTCQEPICYEGYAKIPSASGEDVHFDCLEKEIPKHYDFLEYLGEQFSSESVNDKLFEITADEAKPPTNGFDGGKGGAFGHEGDIAVWNVDKTRDKLKIIITNLKGFEGNKGKGGKAGALAKGRSSFSIVRRCVIGKSPLGIKRVSEPEEYPRRVFIKDKTEAVLTKPALNGIDGRNSAGIKVPKKQSLSSSDQSNILIAFRTYLSGFSSKKLNDFLQLLDESSKVTSLYDTLTYVNELTFLEEFFYDTSLKNTSRMGAFVPSYQSLLSRINKYSEQTNKRIEKVEKKVLRYLYTTILSRLKNMEDSFDNNLKTDVNMFLISVIKQFKSLEVEAVKLNSIKMVAEQKNDFKNYFETKNKEAKEFISEHLKPAIEKANENINQQVDKWLKEVAEMEKQAKEHKEKLERDRKQLLTAVIIQTVLGVFNFVGSILTLIPSPHTKVAGAIIQGTAKILDSLLVNKPGKPEFKELQSSVTYMDKGVNVFIQREVSTFQWKIDAIKRESIKDNKGSPRLLKGLEDLRNEAEKLKKSTTNINSTEKLRKELEDLINREKQSNYKINSVLALKKTKKKKEEKPKKGGKKGGEKEGEKEGEKGGEKDEDNKKIDKWEVIEGIVSMAPVAADFISTLKKGTSELAEYDEAIKKQEKKIKEIQNYEKNIRKTIMPAISKMQEDLNDVADNLAGQSEAGLSMSMWHIDTAIADMKDQLKLVTEGFNIQKHLLKAFDSLQSSMDMLINMYKRIQQYEKDKMLGNFVADINSIQENEIVPDVNSPYFNATMYLDFIIRANVGLQVYGSAIASLKHTVFPFADMYFMRQEVPSQLQYGNNVNELVRRTVTQLQSLKTSLREFEKTITNNDEFVVVREDFTKQNPLSKPFFIWSRYDHEDMITELLSGKEVTVIANQDLSGHNGNAIKFKNIYFRLVTSKRKQYDLNRVLKDFCMIAIHSGLSKYRYDNQTFMVTAPSVRLSYCYILRDSEVTKTNTAYTIIEKSAFFLSPYTVWKLRLQQNMYGRETFTLDELNYFKGQVDLLMEGKGSYVLENTVENVDMKLEKYYSKA